MFVKVLWVQVQSIFPRDGIEGHMNRVKRLWRAQGFEPSYFQQRRKVKNPLFTIIKFKYKPVIRLWGNTLYAGIGW